MAFVNEYIPEVDYEKYDIKRVCGEYTRALYGEDMYGDNWTVNREEEVFLIKMWTHREAEFSGYAFYWKGEWMFFEMRPADYKYDETRNSIWFRFLVKGFVVPDRLFDRREVLIADLRAAITASPGTVTHNYAHRTATIEFITE